MGIIERDLFWSLQATANGVSLVRLFFLRLNLFGVKKCVIQIQNTMKYKCGFTKKTMTVVICSHESWEALGKW